MAGLDPAIHVAPLGRFVDARPKAGHDARIGLTPYPSRSFSPTITVISTSSIALDMISGMSLSASP